MLIKNKVTGEIYPYTDYLFNTDRYVIYEPLMNATDEFQEKLDEELRFKDIFKNIPKSAATKAFVEVLTDTTYTDREYKKILERVYG